MTHPPHPAAEAFPLLAGDELASLTEDIRTQGLHQPITLDPDGRVLDGRNRLSACEAAGVEPRWKTYGGEPVAFVVSANLQRRHLNESQRAMVAARLATLGDNQRKSPASIEAGEVSQPEAAALLGVSRSAVQRAAKVHKSGAPELIEAVERDEIAVSMAAKVAELPEEVQQKLLRVSAVKAKAVTVADVDAAACRHHAAEALTKLAPGVRGKIEVVAAAEEWTDQEIAEIFEVDAA